MVRYEMLGLTIRQIGSCLRDRSVTSWDLCDQAVRRAEQIKQLNAFITLDKISALCRARESDLRYSEGKAKGPLDGVPVAVKDNFCTEGIKTTCGSRMLQSFIPTYNATVVQKLLNAGAVLLGKCNMDEFAMGCGTVDSVFGPTKNIWLSSVDPSVRKHEIMCTNVQNEEMEDWHISGGSSGGSAVAVASGAVFASLGSDTGGSTRNPAAYCGVVGYKPTFGLLSRHGLIPLVNSMDVPGILTRTVEDAVTILNIVAGWDQKDSTTLNVHENVHFGSGIRIKDICVGIPIEYHCPGLSEEVLETWNLVADMLESAGATVKEVSLPYTHASVACYSVLNQCEVASNMARYDGIEFGLRSTENRSSDELFASSRREGFGEVVRSRILGGNYFLLHKNYTKYFLQALKIRRLIVNDFERVWASGVDVLLTPTTLTDAPKYLDFIQLENQQQCVMQDYCTQPVNLAGYPAISIPIKVSKNGLPIGLQLIGRFSEDNTVLSIAKFVENAVSFPKLTLDEVENNL